MRIGLLGGFTLEVNGRDVGARPWRLRKSRTLVKMLALAPDQRLHRDRLLELLWPEREAAAAANNLHQALHVARHQAADAREDTGVLVIRDGVVVLHADRIVETDVQHFRELAAHAWSTRSLEDLTAAIDAYAGELLPEDRFEDWTGAPREDLRRAFCDLLVRHAADSGRAGASEAAFESLRRVFEVDPLHERATRQVMALLAAQGRRTEALSRYERLRHDLAEAYGTDPDPETRRLYRELLAGSVDAAQSSRPVPASPAATRAASPSPRPSGRTNLQPPLTSFIGRQRQVAEIHGELLRARLVTLTGPGGVGKTRLAEEAVRGVLDTYRDGAWAVDLTSVTTSERLPDAVGEAMGLDPGASADQIRTLIARLAGRQLLLLLDNCEHLVDACADLVRRLLRACPDLRVVATSREPLHVAGEVTLRVPSLALPAPTDQVSAALTHEAVRLLVDRAHDARPDFRLDESTVHNVVDICRRLDGVPLAIELAAARLAHLTPAEISERLSSAFTVLGGGDRVTRHGTLRATLEWSHDLLTEQEQVLLRRLSIFAGTFTLRAVEGICAAKPLEPSMILDCVGHLVDKSMVQVERSGDRSRYRLLDTIRQYERERLIAAGEATTLQGMHSAYFLRLAQHHDPDRHPGVVTVRPQLLDEEHDNLRAALDWSLQTDPDRALLLAVSMGPFWLARGHFVEGSRWLERALAVASPDPHANRARALLVLALLDARRGRASRFTELGAGAVREMEQLRSPVDAAFTRVLVGFHQPITGNVDEADATAARGLVDAEQLASPRVAVAALWLQSLVALCREDGDGALRCLQATLAATTRVGSGAAGFLPAVTMAVQLIPCGGRWVPVFEETALIGRQVGRAQAFGHIRSAIGSAYRLGHDLGSAVAAARRSTEIFFDLGDDAGLALSLNQLGCVERDLGRFDDARAHLNEALRLRRQFGDRRGENLTLANLGVAEAAAGDSATGRHLVGTALGQSREVEDQPGVGGSLLNLAVVELFAGQLQRSRHLAEEVIEVFRPQGYRRLTAWALQLAAELAILDGHPDAGQRRSAEAAALFADLGCRIGQSRAGAVLDPVSAKTC